MKLIPTRETSEGNDDFIQNPDCQDSIYMLVEFYKKIGFNPPWIGYYAKKDGQLVGSAGFKGAPKNGKVQIAYSTFPRFQQQGFGTEICRQLVQLALDTDPTVTITARTLPKENYSTKILQKNGFNLVGVVRDEDDGNVWEWVYFKNE
ncbi:MAG: GNAT family N-acetyltransferase [Saprospiraceae bacterium]|nr:GNAT family N-acetyltransferase [Saprospiraceae bacterium]